MSFKVSEKKRLQYVCEDIMLKIKYGEKFDTTEALVYFLIGCKVIDEVIDTLTVLKADK